MQHHVPAEDVRRTEVEAVGDHLAEAPGIERSQGPDGDQVGLAVEQQALLVDVAIEMYGQLGNPHDRTVDADQHLSNVAVSPNRQSSREPEITIEPRVQEYTAVHVDTQLPESGARPVGVGPHPEVGAVRVCADDPEAALGQVMIARAPGNQRAAPADGPEAGLGGPRVPFVDDSPAGRLELIDDSRDRVERARRCVDVRAQALGHGEIQGGHVPNDGACRHKVVERPDRWLALRVLNPGQCCPSSQRHRSPAHAG